MTTTSVDLDKTFTGPVSTYGSITTRVVVLKPMRRGEEVSPVEAAEPGDDAEPPTAGDNPLSSYLEKPSHGRYCIVLLVNGQRHEAWDNLFISQSLGFKYLRTRTMIIIDLDGLTHEATSKIVQGSRQGLYHGEIMGAIKDRVVATLKNDPDLVRLQAEAEQRISELGTGDEVVRSQLDQLIEEHHAAASHASPGVGETGGMAAASGGRTGPVGPEDVVVEDLPTTGEEADYPVLSMLPDVMKVRVRPGQERPIAVVSVPEDAWPKLREIEVLVSPPVPELKVTAARGRSSFDISFLFEEPEDFDSADYPVETTLQVLATFEGCAETRLLEREIVINKRAVPPPPPPAPVLSANPTKLSVVSRLPVKLVAGGPSTHVRLRWDGDDSLMAGANPSWMVRARCLSIGTFPDIGSSQPKDGRFDLLLDAPHGLAANTILQFEVEAIGPMGRSLSAQFSGRVVEPPATVEPRERKAEIPLLASQRKPPYELKVVKEADWESGTCWGERRWTAQDAGAFSDPTESNPLILIVNQDAADIKTLREDMVRRSLEESTVKERVTRYTSHIAFHLYQMYRHKKNMTEAGHDDAGLHVPSDEELQLEIGRVSTTLVRLMAIAR